jgi:hypothetical protein
MVTAPVRAAPPFGATTRVTEPGPLPAAPSPTVTHGAVLVAVHEHPGCAETGTT